MMGKEYVKEDVMKILKKRPEGLTFVELTRETKTSKPTLTKYVYELIGGGKIHVRVVGSAKLCYLKEGEHEN